MISLKEIGRLCGVSESTVSKALKDHPAVSAATRRRVQEVAREHHYLPNAHVQGIQSGQSRCIGVALNDFGDPYSGAIMRGAQRVLHERGYDVLVIPWDLMVDRHEGVFDRFASRRVDGVLLFPPAQPPTPEMLGQLNAMGAAVVLIDQTWEGCRYDYVGSDNVGGGRAAARLLLDHGCRRIGLLGMTGVSSGRERVQGVLDELSATGNKKRLVTRVDLVSTDPDDARNRRDIESVFGRNETPDGLICFNDWVAMLALNIAQERGLAVPQELEIVGFGNLPESRLTRPALTTFDQQPEWIGQLAAQRLIDRIRKLETSSPGIQAVPALLRERLTTNEQHALPLERARHA